MFPFTQPPYLLLRAYRLLRVMALCTIGVFLGVAAEGPPILHWRDLFGVFAGIFIQLATLFVLGIIDPDHWLVLPDEEEYNRPIRPRCDEHDAPLDPALGCLHCKVVASGKTLAEIDAFIKEIDAPAKKE